MVALGKLVDAKVSWKDRVWKVVDWLLARKNILGFLKPLKDFLIG